MANFALLAKIGVDSKALQSGLAGAKGSMQRFTDSVKKMAAAAKAAAAVALVALAKKAIDAGSQISDLSEQLRINTEALQVLMAVSKKAGVDQGSLERALRNVSIRTQEAIDGNKMYADSFARLGIDLKKFAELPTEQKLEVIAQAYTKAGKSQEAFADIAQVLGNRAGPKMLEVLRRLNDEGLEPLTKEARMFGQVMDEETIKTMDEAADTIGIVANAFVVFAAKTLNFVTKQVKRVGVLFEFFSDVIEPLDPLFNKIGEGFLKLMEKMKKISPLAAMIMGVKNYNSALESSIKTEGDAIDSKEKYNEVLNDELKEQAKVVAMAEAIAEKKKQEKEDYEELTRSVGEYVDKVNEARNAEQEKFIKDKELEALKLRAEGQKEQAEALEEYIVKVKEAIRINNEYATGLKEAVGIVQGIATQETIEAATTAKGENLATVASEVGEKVGISFKETTDGVFQQFIDGIKQDRTFTEKELQDGIREQIEKAGNQEKLLSEIKDALAGKFTNQ